MEMRWIVAGKSATVGGIVIALAPRLLDIVDANIHVVGGCVLVGLGQQQASRFSRHRG